MECPHCHIFIGQPQDKCPNCESPLTETQLVYDGLSAGAQAARSSRAISHLNQSPEARFPLGDETIGFPDYTDQADASRYRILSEIGRGAAGVVYLAQDTHVFDRKVAIKRIALDRFNLENASNTSAREVLNHFMVEPRALAGLTHSNVVHIYDCGVDEQGVYIVMEYVAGGSLQQKIDAEITLDTPTVLSIAIQLCDALSEVHSLGIVHRDIKPKNILLTHRGMPKLSDFGIVLELSQSADRGKGTFMGTKAYMSPEQKIDSSTITPKSDIYSLGATLFACLTGLSPEQYSPDKLPETIRTPIALAMEENPADRFDNARMFKRALQDLVPEKTGAAVESQYPCYACRKPVQYTSLFCPNCGKNVSAMREAAEKRCKQAVDQATAFVAAGRFDRARKELELALKGLGHDHFGHHIKEIEQKREWVSKKESDAQARKSVLLKKLDQANEHMAAAQLEDALAVATEVAAEQGPFFNPIVEKAKKTQSVCKSILGKREALGRDIHQAVDLARKGDYDKAFAVLDQVASEDALHYDEVRRDALTTKQRLVEQQMQENTVAAQKTLAVAQDALASGDLQTALRTADHLSQSKEPYLSPCRDAAQRIAEQCNALHAEKSELSEIIRQAATFAEEKDYSNAILLTEQVRHRAGAAFEPERRLAEQRQKTYIAKERAAIRSRSQKRIEAAEKGSRRDRRSLIDILRIEGDYINDLQSRAYRLLRRRSWAVILKALIAYLVLSLIGVAFFFDPGLSVLGYRLNVIAKKARVREGPSSDADYVDSIKEADPVVAYGLKFTDRGEPWIRIYAPERSIRGYVWANLLGRDRRRPVFRNGVISEPTDLKEQPGSNSRTELADIQPGVPVAIIDSELYQKGRGFELWMKVQMTIESRLVTGWVNCFDVRSTILWSDFEAKSVYVRFIPLILVLGLAIVIQIVVKKAQYLKTIRSLRPKPITSVP